MPLQLSTAPSEAAPFMARVGTGGSSGGQELAIGAIGWERRSPGFGNEPLGPLEGFPLRKRVFCFFVYFFFGGGVIPILILWLQGVWRSQENAGCLPHVGCVPRLPVLQAVADAAGLHSGRVARRECRLLEGGVEMGTPD